MGVVWWAGILTHPFKSLPTNSKKKKIPAFHLGPKIFHLTGTPWKVHMEMGVPQSVDLMVPGSALQYLMVGRISWPSEPITQMQALWFESVKSLWSDESAR